MKGLLFLFFLIALITLAVYLTRIALEKRRAKRAKWELVETNFGGNQRLLWLVARKQGTTETRLLMRQPLDTTAADHDQQLLEARAEAEYKIASYNNTK